MSAGGESILLIGESGVGKTHYGAQLLKRLMKGDGQLRMDGAATNLEPFEAAMESLNEGMAAGHTPTATYVDSIWPIADGRGRKAEPVWPDYGGEQIRAMSSPRRIPAAWRARVVAAPAWLLLVRLQQTRVADDIFVATVDHGGPSDGVLGGGPKATYRRRSHPCRGAGRRPAPRVARPTASSSTTLSFHPRAAALASLA